MATSDLVNEAAIEAAYLQSGNTLGWRLLSSPASTIEGADIAFIGLNPGGHRYEPDHPSFAVPGTSAYVDESWKGAPPGESPLQKQVRALFRGLGAKPEDVLSGNLVPFRSPSWADLNNKPYALDFGFRIWREILGRARPRLVIGMGRQVTQKLKQILATHDEERVTVGWGNVSATRAVFTEGRLVGLPHLSRFPIVGRPQSSSALQLLFGADWQA